MERMWRRLSAVAAIGMMLALPAAASGAGQALPPTPQGGGLNAVQCWAVGHCLAVGGSARGVLVDRLSGTRWSIVAAPNPAGGGGGMPTLSGLACIGSRWCLAVGSNRCGGPLAERWNGQRWSLVNVDLPVCQSGVFTDVSCGSSSFCMAVDSVDYIDEVVTWDGTAWRGYRGGSPPPANSFSAVACAARHACAEAGSNNGGNGSVVGWWNGHDWGLDRLNDGGPPEGSGASMNSVSCPSVSFCMAVGSGYTGGGGSGAAIVWNGWHWGREAFSFPPYSPGPPIAVSCASRAECVALLANPDIDSESASIPVATFNGSAWTTTASTFQALDANPTAISCPVVGWCMVVGYLVNNQRSGPLTPVAGVVH